MLASLIQSKKSPRLFLVQGLSANAGFPSLLKGVRLQWPERLNHFESEVLDISLSGIVIPNSPLLSKVKLEQSFELKLKLGWKEGLAANSVLLKCRVGRLTGKMIGLVFESISLEGRLVLDQAIKDNLVQDHLREISTSELSPQLRSDIWVYGPFDTNFFVWFKEDGGLKQALVEYDHLIWIYKEGQITLERSASVMDEARGYLAPDALFLQPPTSGRVVMGASWLDRLLKLLDVPSLQAEKQSVSAWASRLQPLVQLLKSQRSQ